MVVSECTISSAVLDVNMVDATKIETCVMTPGFHLALFLLGYPSESSKSVNIIFMSFTHYLKVLGFEM